MLSKSSFGSISIKVQSPTKKCLMEEKKRLKDVDERMS